MSHVDLRKLALRLKVLEMLRTYAERRKMANPAAWWLWYVCPN